MRPLVVLLTFLFAAPAGAEDKPSAKLDKPADARRAALVKAGYTAVPMTLDAQWLSLSVNGSVGQERASFLISGGTPDTVLDMKLAKRLNLPLGPEVAFGAGNGFAQLAARQMFAPGSLSAATIPAKTGPTSPEWSPISPANPARRKACSATIFSMPGAS